jgi:hypothetical protein
MAVPGDGTVALVVGDDEDDVRSGAFEGGGKAAGQEGEKGEGDELGGHGVVSSWFLVVSFWL